MGMMSCDRVDNFKLEVCNVYGKGWTRACLITPRPSHSRYTTASDVIPLDKVSLAIVPTHLLERTK